MAVMIKMCVPLQKCTQGRETLYDEPGSLIDILNKLQKKYPGLHDILMSNGKIKDYFIVSINDKIIDDAEFSSTILRDGDEVSIMPLVIGG